MTDPHSPASLIQQQLDAYNARNLDAWLSTYASDAKQFEFPQTLLASGHDQIRTRSASRFEEPNLHARLLHRTVLGNVVIDHERVTRTFPEGTGTLELLAIYEVRDGKIQSGSFVFGEKTLDSAPENSAIK